MRLNDKKIKVDVCAKIGTTEIKLGQLLQLKSGKTFCLNRPCDEPLEISANNCPVGYGVAVAGQNGKVEVVITEKL